jgi:putative endonuclease
MFYTYIIFSEQLQKYYAGYSSDIEKRLYRHGKDKKKFTGKANDWVLVKYFEFENKTDAIKLEIKIKNRGIRRFLEDLNKRFNNKSNMRSLK